MDLSTKFKDYKILEEIGEGSTGTVYKVINIKNNKIYSLKNVIFLYNNDKQDNIITEIKILKKLKNGNIIKLIDYEILDSEANILYEYINYGNLKELIIEFGSLKEELAIKIGINILDGLDYLHSKNIIHGDLKPLNILVNINGDVKISDFGSSVKFNSNNSYEFEHRELKGTIIYMPPEILKQETISRRSDIWSFGCLLCEIISGKHPWSNLNHENAYSIILHIGNNSVIPEVPDNISLKLKEIILLCFKRDFKERPTAKYLKQLLSSINK